MLHIEGAIVVEGRYDKARLKNIVDCPVIVTNGFGIFKDGDTVRLIRHYAKNGGIIILTDGDSAGFKIRSHIKGIVPDGVIKNAYIPDIFGKEKRKPAPSAEGKLGVEGVPDEIIIKALRECTQESAPRGKRLITTMDLYEDGLSGGKNSSHMRSELLKHLDLPERLPPKSLLDALNASLDYNEYKEIVEKIKEERVL